MSNSIPAIVTVSSVFVLALLNITGIIDVNNAVVLLPVLAKPIASMVNGLVKKAKAA